MKLREPWWLESVARLWWLVRLGFSVSVLILAGAAALGVDWWPMG